MDFSFTTAHPAPVPVTINGKTYQVPRFLLPEFKARAQAHRDKVIKEATKELDKQTKAQFLTFYSPPQVDTAEVADSLLTPAGVDEVLRLQFKAAGVPDEDADAVLKSGSPLALRNLAKEICSAHKAADDEKAESGNGEGTPENPPSADSGQTPTSADSHTTTSETERTLPEATAA